MEVYRVIKCNYGSFDYEVNFNGSMNNIINDYLKEHKMSKKSMAGKYDLNYNSFLQYLRGESSWNGGYNHIGRKIIQEQECKNNNIKYNLNLNLNNFEIEFILLFCNFIKNNKDKDIIKVSGTSFTHEFDNILKYLNENNINITINYSFNGRGDNDPYIDFKINSYSNDKINDILNILDSK